MRAPIGTSQRPKLPAHVTAEVIRQWMRWGNDTAAIARFYLCPEAEVWNRLAQGMVPDDSAR